MKIQEVIQELERIKTVVQSDEDREVLTIAVHTICSLVDDVEETKRSMRKAALLLI